MLIGSNDGSIIVYDYSAQLVTHACPGRQYLILISINYKLVKRLLCVMNQPIDRNRLRCNPPPAYDSFTFVLVGSWGMHRLLINKSLKFFQMTQ